MSWTDPKSAGIGSITGDTGGPDTVFAGYSPDPVIDYERVLGSHAVLWNVTALNLATVSVSIQGSLDGSTWYALDGGGTTLSATGTALVVCTSKPARYVRTATNITGTTGAQGSATISASVIASEEG